MLKKIISGGQTGADRAALDFAIKNNIPHGGWVPKGRLAEDGPISSKYNLTEMPSDSYKLRTEQNVIDSAPSGHQFQDQPVSDLTRPENDLIDSFLFDDVPVCCDLRSEQFATHGRVAGVLKAWTQVVVNEIEKRCEVGESDFPGLRFAAVGDALQERLNDVNREFLQLQVAMVLAERRDY